MNRAEPLSVVGAALRLGRVSNLPTVWTNVLAGAVLAGAPLSAGLLTMLATAMSALYVGGMYLNDAFDAEWDRAHRPERPIPAGVVARSTVFTAGFGMLAFGVALVAALLVRGEVPSVAPVLAALLTAGLIVFYDLHHKNNALSPLVMATTRVGVYATAGLCAARVDPAVWIAAGALLCHVIGLSYVAKHETASRLLRLWPVGFLLVPLVYAAWLVLSADAPLAPGLLWVAYMAAGAVALTRVPGFGARPNPGVAIPLLIANMSLLDGLFVAAAGHGAPAVLCAAAWVLTLLLQRKVPGT